jgi:osmotically-inducible protein OsmY
MPFIIGIISVTLINNYKMKKSDNLSTLSIMYDGRKDNGQLAAEVLNACKIKWEVPNDRISANVENGWVTLEGELEWAYQGIAAVNAVQSVKGVKGVYNHMHIKPPQQEIAEIRM